MSKQTVRRFRNIGQSTRLCVNSGAMEYGFDSQTGQKIMAKMPLRSINWRRGETLTLNEKLPKDAEVIAAIQKSPSFGVSYVEIPAGAEEPALIEKTSNITHAGKPAEPVVPETKPPLEGSNDLGEENPGEEEIPAGAEFQS